MYEKIFDRCLHETVIKNKYTDENVYIECGKCPHCLRKKADKATTKCRFQASASKYTYFVTLTYNSQYVPKMSIREVTDYQQVVPKGHAASLMTVLRALVETHRDLDRSQADIWQNPKNKPIIQSSIQKVLQGSGMFNPDANDLNEYRPFVVATLPRVSRLHNFNKDVYEEFLYWAKPSIVKSLVKKSNTDADGKFPQFKGLLKYIHYPDYQAYAKRLRKYLFKKIGKYEQISSYIVSEYSPKTLRPHFHILYSFNSDNVARLLRDAVYQSWRLGRCDTQRVEGNAAAYTAGYCNSIVKLPSIYKQARRLQPKGRFSANYAFEEVQKIAEESRDFRNFAASGIPFSDNGKYSYYFPSSAHINKLFPRFTRSDGRNVEQVENLVRSIGEAIKEYNRFNLDEVTPSRLSRFIVHLDYSNSCIGKDSPEWLLYIAGKARVLNYTCKRLFFTDASVCEKLSRLFYRYNNFMKSGRYWYNQWKRSDEFYKELDVIRLGQFYDTLSQHSREEDLSPELLTLYYVSPHYKRLKHPKILGYDNDNYKEINYVRIKHKVLNDQNNIFCD